MTDKQLTQRMREAAEVLEEAADRFYPGEGLGSIYAHWSSDSLTRVADQWDAKPDTTGTVYVRKEGNGVSVYIEKPGGGVVGVYISAEFEKGYLVQPLAFIPPKAELVWSPV